jgi:hypothetical protein
VPQDVEGEEALVLAREHPRRLGLVDRRGLQVGETQHRLSVAHEDAAADAVHPGEAAVDSSHVTFFLRSEGLDLQERDLGAVHFGRVREPTEEGQLGWLPEAANVDPREGGRAEWVPPRSFGDQKGFLVPNLVQHLAVAHALLRVAVLVGRPVPPRRGEGVQRPDHVDAVGSGRPTRAQVRDGVVVAVDDATEAHGHEVVDPRVVRAEAVLG